MRKIRKILFFVLLLAVLCGTASVFSASAVIDPNAEMTLTGAARAHEDFSGDAYELHRFVDGGVLADPCNTGTGSLDVWHNVKTKYGHLRTLTSKEGNTYLDLTFHEDYTGNRISADDVVVSTLDGVTSVQGLSYFVVEFDMTTRTSYPGNIKILAETRFYDSATSSSDKGSAYRGCEALGVYDSSCGKWIFGENEYTFSSGEWVHITLVTQVSATTTTDSDGILKVNYGASLTKAYVNGEYASSASIFKDQDLDISVVPKLYYAGVGYEFKDAHTGQSAGDSIAIDNCTFTSFDLTYAQDTDRLAALFSDTSVSDITGLGEEIVYTADYAFPDKSIGLAGYVTSDADGGEEILCGDFESAMAQIKQTQSANATVTLYGDCYSTVCIDYPVTVRLNGHTLSNGWVVPSEYYVSMDTESDSICVENDPDKTATFRYYADRYQSTLGTPLFEERFALGRSFVLADTSKIQTTVYIDKNTGSCSNGNYLIYDENGALTELTEITEEHAGKTFCVCPSYDDYTFDEEIAFYTLLDGAVAFYTETDLWAAAQDSYEELLEESTETADDGTVTTTRTSVCYPTAIPDGITYVLVKDCTFSKALYTLGGSVTIDLAGHKLTGTTALGTTGEKKTILTTTSISDADTTTNTESSFFIADMQMFVCSSAEGGGISTGDAYLFSADHDVRTSNGVDYYIGYRDSDTVSEYRITLNVGAKLVHVQKGSLYSVYLAKLDIYSEGEGDGTGLISVAQSRGAYFYFNDCRVFFSNAFVGTTENSGEKCVTLTDSALYGTGKNNLSYIADSGATTADTANTATADGVQHIVIANSTVWGLQFGDAAVDGWYISKEGATPVEKSASTYVTMDESSKVSFDAPQGNINTIAGKRLLAMPQQTVIDGVTYTTVYTFADETTEFATFYIYDVAYDSLNDESLPVATQNVAVGYWFCAVSDPSGELVYDHVNHPGVVTTATAYVVYDSDGTPTEQQSLTDDDANKVYYVCVGCKEESISFAVVDKDGNATPYFDGDISVCATAVTGEDGTFCLLPEGGEIVLFADCYTSQPLLGNDTRIDLGGNSLYVKTKLNTFNAYTQRSLYIYSSKEGARLLQTPTEASGSGYVATLTYPEGKLYFGYRDADTASEYEIEVFCGAFAQLIGEGTQVYLSTLTVCANGTDNYGLFNICKGTDATRAVFVDSCRIYSNRNALFNAREGSATGTFTVRSSSIYCTVSTAIFSWYGARSESLVATVNLENTSLYGPYTVSSLKSGSAVATLYVSGDTVLSHLSEHVVIRDEGKMWLPVDTTVTADGVSAPAGGAYGKAESPYMAGEHTARFMLGTEAQYKALALHNMTLDTSVVNNLYIPFASNILSVTVNAESIFDKTAIESIGGKDYYMLSYGTAPKYGDAQFDITVTFVDGASVSFPMSVTNYAKRLLALDGTASEYVADSQQMMKYVLNYIKQVAVAFGGADASTVFAELGDISVDTGVEITEEIRDASAISAYVTHAALDLNTYAGFAFKIASGFVGEITLSLEGVDAVSFTFPSESPASDDEVITLENVPVRILRGDVTITVTPAEGDAVSAAYNLATYAKTESGEYINALYAYSVKAEEYNRKYPRVGELQ